MEDQSVGIFMMIVIGLIAGWIAEKVTNSDHGIIKNLIVGVIGAFIGGKLAEWAAIPIGGFVRTLAAAIVGAIIFLFAWRKIRGR